MAGMRGMIRCHHPNGPYADDEKMSSCAMNVSGTPLAEGARQTSRQSFVTASGVVRISLAQKGIRCDSNSGSREQKLMQS